MPLDLDALETPEEWIGALRLSRDLREAGRLLSPKQQRILVDLYYQIQDNRKATANQLRAAHEEPNAWITFMTTFMQRMEKLAAGGLDIASNQQAVSLWAKCAPPGSLVQVTNGRWGKVGGQCVPIETLRTGDMVTSFDRRRARMSERPVEVAVRPYGGELYCIQTANEETRVTPEHKWLTYIDSPPETCVVYMMRQGARFRVGWCYAVKAERDRKNGRLVLRSRARAEHADAAWILRVCPSRREASVWESIIATQYGLPTLPFVGKAEQGNAWGYRAEEIETFFASLDHEEQYVRATCCLRDYGRRIEAPLLANIGEGTKESVGGLIVHTTNLVPGLMRIPVVLRGGGMEWRPIVQLRQEPYTGLVYSLNVAEHHSYIQDGLVTRNSIFGIGPVLAAGLAAYIDITRTPSVSALWSLAGLNPNAVWQKGEKRPWNAQLKVLRWKIGDSFMKFHNHPDCFYGHIYAARKVLEVERNAAFLFRDQAEKTLANRRIKDKATRAIYEAGQLPAGRLELRAERVAVKLFLSHYWEVAFYEHYHTLPRSPYILAKEPGLHRHYVPPLGYETIFTAPPDQRG
jgi:Transposase IS116/IS110/IS902 family